MSLSTTCGLYWVDVHDSVFEVDHPSAVCDSTYTSCAITGPNGNVLQAKCNSQQQYPDTTSGVYTTYFCACNGNAVSIPSGVTCSPSCYTFTTQFPTCNLVWLYTGFTVGSASNGITQDTCVPLKCDSTGVVCTDPSETLVYQCDNQDHDSMVASDSTHSYVCNCQGAAQIPELYRGTSGASVGSGCSGSSGGDSGGTEGSSTTQQDGAGTATSASQAVVSSTYPPSTADSQLASTTPVETSASTSAADTSPAPVATSTSASTSAPPPSNFASSRKGVSRWMLLSISLVIVLRAASI